jgi:D-sedoheptulose 7-phosphate isomerase
VATFGVRALAGAHERRLHTRALRGFDVAVRVGDEPRRRRIERPRDARLLDQQSSGLPACASGTRGMRAHIEPIEGVPEPTVEFAVDRVQHLEVEKPATHDRLVRDHEEPVAGVMQRFGRGVGTGKDIELVKPSHRVQSVDVEHSVTVEEKYPVANLKHSSEPVERRSVNLQQAIDDHQLVMTSLAGLVPDVERVADRMVASLRGGGTVFWFGNGGSASQSQHFATELVGRYLVDRPGLASMALTTDGALLTAVANDGAFDDVFARQLDALCRPHDVAVGLSTSGASANVVRGLETARERGAFTVGITGGHGGKVAHVAEAAIVVPSTDTPRIQEAHLFLGHELCHLVEQALVEDDDV